MPFIDQLQHWARTSGQHTAVVVGGQQLTFAQLLHAATATPAPAETVDVIDEPTGTALAVRFCAAVNSGTPAMVLDAQWPPELRRQLGDAARGWGTRATHEPAGEAAFLLGLSSGTSGLPKAFTRNSSSWRESFVRSVEYFGLTAQTVTLAPGPLAASMNLYALAESIYAGSTFVALPHFSIAAALAAMREHNVTRLVVVPTVLELLAGAGLHTQQPGRQLTSIVCAGSALSAGAVALAREWAPNATIQQYYGAAELGFVAASRIPPGGAVAAADSGVGSPFPGAHISIRDSQGMPVADGIAGTIYVRSPYVCDGYAWGDDGLAFSSLAANAPWRTAGPGPSDPDAGEWFTVHDQGQLDDAGRLHVLGRASDMVIVAGGNVYPHAVEAALAAAVGATAAGRHATIVVTGRGDALRGQRLVAGLYIGEGTGSDIAASPGAGTVDTGELLAACRLAAAKLPAHHRPSQYYVLDALPLTGSGKISRAIFTSWLSEGDPRARRLH